MRRIMQFLRSIPTYGLMLLLGWVGLMYPDWVLQLGLLNVVCGGLLLLVFIHPALAQKPLDQSPTRSGPAWFAQLLMAQLGLIILGLAAVVAFAASGPPYISQVPTVSMALGILQDSAFKQWGFFPWGIYAFWALVILYLTRVQQLQPYFYQIALKLSPRFSEPVIKNVVSALCMGTIMMLMGLTIASIILLFMQFTGSLLHVSHLAVPGITAYVFYIGIAVLGLSFGRRLFRRVLSWKTLFPKIISIFVVSLIVGLVLAAYANSVVLDHRPETANRMVCHFCVKFFENTTVETRLTAFFLGWGFIWAPLAGPYIANISRGRSLREMLVGLFALPVIVSLTLWIQPELLSNMANAVLTQKREWISLALSILSFSVLCLMMRDVRHIAWFYCGDFLPEETNRSRYWLKDSPRLISMSVILQRMGLATIMVLMLHTVTGWIGIQIQLSVVAISVSFVMLMGIFFLMGQWYRTRNSLKILENI